MVSTEASYGGSFPCVILKGISFTGLAHGKYGWKESHGMDQ
jgi:hypothetical protein